MAFQTVLHFPDRTEIRYLDVRPQPGWIVSSQRETWVVVSVEPITGESVTCTLVPAGGSSNGQKRARGGRRDMPPSLDAPPRARPSPV